MISNHQIILHQNDSAYVLTDVVVGRGGLGKVFKGYNKHTGFDSLI